MWVETDNPAIITRPDRDGMLVEKSENIPNRFAQGEEDADFYFIFL
jgi:hypothetical protein